MKKLFSSKSGFSLIEIIVAFAIFAVMAAMVSSIMSIALYQRNENLKFADGVEAQKEQYARIEKDTKYVSGSDGGTLSFKVGSGDTLPYCIKTVPGTDNSINYFIGDADYNKKGQKLPSSNPDAVGDPTKDSNSLVNQLDSYIYGSPYFESIRVDKFYAASDAEVAKAESDLGIDISDDMTLYILHVTPNDSPRAVLQKDLIVWRNFSIRMPKDYEIYDCGYIQTSLGGYTKKFDAAQNKYEMTRVSRNSVNVSIPSKYIQKYLNNEYSSADEIYHFAVGNGIEKYYFILNTKDKSLTNTSFGDEWYDDDGTGMPYYRAVKKRDKDGNVITGSDGKPETYANIYAAKDEPTT